MNGTTSHRSFSAVIVAGGKGLRAAQTLPKQFALWQGKPVLAHSLEAFRHANASEIVVVVPDPQDERARAIVAPFPGAMLVQGGSTRRESVLAGLEALDSSKTERVLIHDAARPRLSSAVIDRLLDALTGCPGAIPVLPVVDSLAIEREGKMDGSARREDLRRVQTPQAFHFEAILKAHKTWDIAREAGDDAQVALAAGFEVAHVEGDEALKKLTFAEDFAVVDIPVRVGTGFDVHRLGEGEELWLCGVHIDHDRGLIGHSDADVGLHAITDAILGAVAAGDIGQHFSPNDPRWKSASSDRFLVHARDLASEKSYRVGAIDLTLICEEPKIGPYRTAMVERIAEILQIDAGLVSVKATTTERLGFTGRGEGIAAQAVATMVAKN